MGRHTGHGQVALRHLFHEPQDVLVHSPRRRPNTVHDPGHRCRRVGPQLREALHWGADEGHRVHQVAALRALAGRPPGHGRHDHGLVFGNEVPHETLCVSADNQRLARAVRQLHVPAQLMLPLPYQLVRERLRHAAAVWRKSVLNLPDLQQHVHQSCTNRDGLRCLVPETPEAVPSLKLVYEHTDLPLCLCRQFLAAVNAFILHSIPDGHHQ
mmetsp:Transcript_32777/g.83565  ORF Transcript_32777/g.83565 Transcript_32777/m.83565 type:complete len:212 (+) Transcript_32777:1634-2269(+)